MTDAPGARELVAFDLETTGLFPEIDRIVEIGAVRFDAVGYEIDRFERLVQPGRPVPKAAQTIHGITDAMLADALPARVVLPEFLDWLGPSGRIALLAHNARFDAGFLGSELARLGQVLPDHLVYDTLDLARRRLPQAPSHQLDTLARLLGIDPDSPHRALSDSRRVKGLWLALADGTWPVPYPIFDGSASPVLLPAGWEVAGGSHRARPAGAHRVRGRHARRCSADHFAPSRSSQGRPDLHHRLLPPRRLREVVPARSYASGRDPLRPGWFWRANMRRSPAVRLKSVPLKDMVRATRQNSEAPGSLDVREVPMPTALLLITFGVLFRVLPWFTPVPFFGGALAAIALYAAARLPKGWAFALPVLILALSDMVIDSHHSFRFFFGPRGSRT